MVVMGKNLLLYRAFVVVIGTAIVLFGLLFVSACGGKAGNPSKETAPTAPKAESSTVSSKGKSWGGWRWKGDRDKCYYSYKRQCFTSKSKACRKAGCKTNKCLVTEAVPAKVSCPSNE